MPRDEPESTPACQGTNPELFDWAEFAPTAIDICGACKVQAWCLRQVDPARSYFDGVAGGHQWREGQVLDRWTNPAKDLTLQIYLRPKKPRRTERVNEQRVSDFMVGLIPWNRITIEERHEAARRLAKQQTPPELIAEITKLIPEMVEWIITTSNTSTNTITTNNNPEKGSTK